VLSGAFGPAALTALLLAVHLGDPRDYIYLYLGIVAVLGIASGLLPAAVAALASFLLVDYYFVPPFHTLQFSQPADLLNLCLFGGVAISIGTVGSRRRSAQLRSEALTRELQTANDELIRLSETERQMRLLQQTDRMRGELLANVSHELRTPLSSILTQTTSILQRPGLSQDLRAELESAAVAAQRLSRLVSDILDMNRIDGGIVQLQRADVDLREAVDAAAARLHRRSPERPVQAEIPASMPEVFADWDRLGQVLDNLLSNADRASPPGSAIRVAAASNGGGEVTIEVIDSGPGIPVDEREHVFERFVRDAHPAGRESAGLGLGLPIVRGLVEAHGGRAWARDTATGRGANVSFTLPAVVAAPASRA